MTRKYAKREPKFPSDENSAPEANQLAQIAEPPVPVAPPPPNPAVIALQGDIVDLVRQRSQVRNRIMEANSVLYKAQAEFQAAQSEMKALEEEVHYLHSQVAQLEGRQELPQVGYGQAYATSPNLPSDIVSVSSAPTMPAPAAMAGRAAEGINRGHATREMY